MLSFLFKRGSQSPVGYRALEVSLSRECHISEHDEAPSLPEMPATLESTLKPKQGQVCFDVEAAQEDGVRSAEASVHKKAFIRMSKKIMSQRSYSVNFNIAASGLLDDDDGDGEQEGKNDDDEQENFKGMLKGFFKHLVVVPELSEALKAKGFVHWVEVWDLSITVLIFLLAYYLPWILVFCTWKELPAFHRLLETIMSLVYTVDMFLQFFIAYALPNSQLSHGPWQKDPWKIISNYMGFESSFGWFWLDLLSVAPFWMRVLNGDRSFPYMEHFQMLCLLRVLKMIRMINLPRLWRFMSRWQASFGFSYLIVDFCKFIFILTLTAHLFACVWVAIEGKVTRGVFSYATADNTWLSALIESKGDPCHPSAAKDSICVYWLAMYWAVMTLTSVGYGDVTPQNQLEYTVCAIMMMFSGLVWAYIVGSVVSLIHTMDTSVEFKQNMDQMNEMMESRGLPTELRVRMRRYMHECVVARHQTAQENLLRNTISQGLQREVARNSQRYLLKLIYWAKEFPDEAKMELVKRFHPTFFGPDEAIMLRKAVLVIQKGIMGVRGRVLRRGDVLGLESILLETNSLIETSQPRTLSYCFVMVLKRDDLLEVAREFEQADRQLRRAQIRAAVRRAFLTSAAAEKQERKNRSISSIPDLQRERSSRSIKRTFTQSNPPSFSGDLTRMEIPPDMSPRDQPRGPQNAQAIAYSKSAGRFSRVNLEDVVPSGNGSQETLLAALERVETQNLQIRATQESIIRQLHLLGNRSEALAVGL